MTNSIRKIAIAGATAIAVMASSAAFAGNANSSEFTVKRTNSPAVRVAVKAFRKGEFERAARLNQQALREGLSKSRSSIAYSNLCASYAMQGEMEKAGEACQSAVDMNPENVTAQANKRALTVRLAQANSQTGE